MSNVAIVTDSAVSLPQKMMDDLKIEWVPYYIHRGGETLRDLVTIKRKEFYTWLATATKVPTTANPGPNDYFEKYSSLVHQGAHEIVSIHISSLGSGAYKAAVIAKEMMREKLPSVRIEVIDTMTVSLCHGWVVIEAARNALKGGSFESVVNTANRIIPITKMMQTADTLKYLYLGGRIGKAKHLLASKLNIKPIIGVEDGLIVPLGQARTLKKTYESMIQKMEDIVGDHPIKIAYVHAAALDKLDLLKEMVEGRFQIVESLVAELSPALGVHTGPGTTGFCFYPVLED